MRTRKGSKAQEDNAGLDKLLHSLHGASPPSFSVNGNGAPETLADASRHTVDHLLDRVGARRTAAKKRQAATAEGSVQRSKRHLPDGEDALFWQRQLAGDVGSIQRKSNSDSLVCGARAQTTYELEQVRQPTDSSASKASGSNLTEPSGKKEVQESHSVEDDEQDWEDGDDRPEEQTALANTPVKSWTGEVTFDAEGSPAVSGKRQTKSTLRRANAKDKLFAIQVHMAHLLCLLARGRMISAASDDPLLQASIVSVLPQRLLPDPVIDRMTTARLEHLVSWVRFRDAIVSAAKSTNPALERKRQLPLLVLYSSLVNEFKSQFRLLLPEGGSTRPRLHSKPPETTLQEVLQKQAGSAEELAAISVALFRGLGLSARYVTVLDVASIKPDEESLEASVDWDPDAPFEHSRIGSQFHADLERQVSALSKIVAHCAPSLVTNVGKPGALKATASTDLRTGTNGGGRGESSAKGRGRGRSQGRGREGSKWERDKDSAASDSVSPLVRRGRSKGKQNAGPSFDDTSLATGAQITTPTRTYGRKRRGGKRASSIDGDDANNDGDATLDSGGECRTVDESIERNASRKGDDEFEAQVAMAIAATAAAAKVEGKDSDDPNNEKKKATEAFNWRDYKRQKSNTGRSNLFEKEGKGATSGAVWSRKMGPVLHWAEVYCGGEASSGRWVQVDATRGIVDGADQVEGTAAACRSPLRYVVAFAGLGAKDITRRYVSLWSSVAPLRVDADWWDKTLHPLRQLEAAATAGPSVVVPLSCALNSTLCGVKGEATRGTENLGGHRCESEMGTSEGGSKLLNTKIEVSSKSTGHKQASTSQGVNRSLYEDMELDTKLYTEPLPTSQQAYKTHHLYVLERWLSKYEVLHPKGPVLGYCGGQPVFPRTCVTTLHTPDRWLREGCKVMPGESPAKIVKSRAAPKGSTSEMEDLDRVEGSKGPAITELFGKWQTVEWQPPRAVGGIVPRNERGQVDVFSEKCLPPGTVHLRFPRLVPVAQRLEIDFAPAMVGFEIRRGRSVPVFEGLVVCEEFQDALMEAYFEEETRRNAQLLKKKEEQAASRWRQLLLSVATRKRLQATYKSTPPEKFSTIDSFPKTKVQSSRDSYAQTGPSSSSMIGTNQGFEEVSTEEGDKVHVDQTGTADPQHVHHFMEQNQTYDDESGIRTKWCVCGFRIQVEEM